MVAELPEHGPLSFASLSGSGASLPEVINSMFEPTLDFEDLEWIRSVWPGKLFLKGVLGVEDAQHAHAGICDLHGQIASFGAVRHRPHVDERFDQSEG